jgi:DNA-binding GntR family transcriptional regulator
MMVYHKSICVVIIDSSCYPRPMADLLKIEKTPETLRDMVQARMREAIVSGHFAPGERLVERPLCEQLGVSRTVIRETIRYLEAEGLVDIIPNKGPIVATLSWEQAAQIYDIREQLEGSAAAACAAMQRPALKDKLTPALRRVAATMNDAEWAGVLEATTRFYEVIFQEAGHEIAWGIVQRLNGRISRLRALTIAARDHEFAGMSHMNAIHDAILEGDPQKARGAIVNHIGEAALTAKRLLDTHAERQNG